MVSLEAMKELLRKKGAGMVKSKRSEKKDKKTAMFAEAASKGASRKPEPKVKYSKCVVAFAIRVDKEKDTKAGFDKKIVAALSFLQTYINKHVAFFSTNKLDLSRPPIKEKADVPAFQVILCKHFDIPNKRAFDSVNQDGGRAIKGSAVMGFLLDPQKCLEEAAGDLRHMGCAFFYKKCQEVSMVAWQILLGAPNTIKEDIIKQTLDKELKLVEQKLLPENNTECKLPQQRQSKWLNYAVVREFPAGMPWEGAEEKKQKQGTDNARLVYVLHVHEPDYARMKMLLAYAKEWKVWHKHWGNSAFTVEIPTEKSPQAEKTRYIQMIQTHGSIQLRMGAASLEGLINADTTFTLRLLPDADGKARPPTSTFVREIFSLMEISDKKVWICVSTGSNGRTKGYFSSVVQEISKHVAAFIAFLGAQVYWWLRRRGCITVDVNNLIRYCFTLSQQQKVTSSKYLKDLGHTVVERTDGDDIIHATTSAGIYNLPLGLSDKERRLLVAPQGYDAAAITYGKAKEGAVEAHNLSIALSVTSLHSTKGKGAEEKPGPTPTLAQSVYSIGMSKVTKDSEDKSGKEEEGKEADGSSASKQVAIDGMDILHSNGKHGVTLFSTASMEETSKKASKGERYMGVDSAEREESDSSEENKWQEEEKEESYFTAKMNMATAKLHLRSNDEGSNFQENNMSIHSDDLDLNLHNYVSNAQEVSSGEFNAAYIKKYTNPKNLSACSVECGRAFSGNYGFLFGHSQGQVSRTASRCPG